MEIGVQLRPWLVEGLSAEEALVEAGAAGYSAVEVGYRFVAPLGVERLRGTLGDQGLAVTALHLTPDWAQASTREVRDLVADAARLVTAIGGQYLLASLKPDGLGGPGAMEIARTAGARLAEAASEAKTYGAELCVHNHGWEFTVPGVFDEICGELPLAVDLAHLWRAGENVVDRLVEWADRVCYLHVRDGVDGHWTDVLGSGTLPLVEWVGMCRDRVAWSVVELEPEPEHVDIMTTWSGSWTERATRSRQYLERGLSR